MPLYLDLRTYLCVLSILILMVMTVSGTTCNGRSTYTDTATISPTTNWQTTSNSLSSGTDTKRYKVIVSTQGQYEFSLCSSDGGSANYDSFICLLDSNGNEITHDDDACNRASKITRTLSTGTYYIQVSGYWSSYGSYTLSYRKTPTGTTTTCSGRSAYTDTATIYPTTSWQTTSNSLSSSTDTKRYKVIVSTPGQYEFSLCSSDGGSANYDSFICLLDSNGNEITHDDDACNRASKITRTLSTGTYYIQVSGYWSSYGSYTLSYRKTPSTTCSGRSAYTDTATIYPTTSWQTTSNSLSSSTDTKRYKVIVSTPGQYEFSLCSSDGGSANYDSFICLLDSNGNEITHDDDACSRASKITRTLSTGTYYIQVSGYWSSYGSYTLSYRKTPTCAAFFDPFDFLNASRWRETSPNNQNDPYCPLNPTTSKPYCKIESGNVKFVYPAGYTRPFPLNGTGIHSPPAGNTIYYYGTYEARLKAASCRPNENIVSGFFTYLSDQNNSEIDFELLGEEPKKVYMTIWLNWEPEKKIVRKINPNGKPSVEYTTAYSSPNCLPPKGCPQTTHSPSSVSIPNFDITDYHNYKFQWTRDSVKFMIDDVTVWNMNNVSHIPTIPTTYRFNLWHSPKHWSDGGVAGNLSSDAIMLVDSASYSCG